MDIKQIINESPNKLIPIIKDLLGAKYWDLKKDEDKEQTFWLGVAKALHEVDFSQNPIEYLILSGWNEVRNYNKHTWSRDIVRYCIKCNKYHGYRTSCCPVCGEKMPTIKRDKILLDIHRYEECHDNKINIDMFIKSLSGKLRYIAKRWLIDRADLMYDNHSKQLAYELGISAPRISFYKKKIRTKFKEWEDG